jgi:hypothetical protein
MNTLQVLVSQLRVEDTERRFMRTLDTLGSRDQFRMEANSTIREIVMSLVSAWNSCDARAFGALFTENAVYVGLSGALYQGRTAIAGLLDSQKHHFQVRIEGQVSTYMDEDRGRALFRWISNTDPDVRCGVIRCELVQQGLSWRIDTLKNSAGD